MTSDRLTKLDFVTALALVALGLAVAIESLRMPRLENLNINPYTAPGVVPGLLGVIILLLGAILLVRSARAGGWRLGGIAAAEGEAAPGGAGRVAATLAFALGYTLGLLGNLPFWLATFVFVLLFIVLFEWAAARAAGRLPRMMIVALAQAAITAAAVTWVFESLFYVRLP
jgi:hypothetical protein